MSDELPNGPGAAAIVGAGVGCFAVGLLAVLADGSTSIAHACTLYAPTGPLSGVSTGAIAVWLVTWFALDRLWQTRTLPMARVNAVAIGLLALGALLTFPPFADRLLGK